MFETDKKKLRAQILANGMPDKIFFDGVEITDPEEKLSAIHIMNCMGQVFENAERRKNANSAV